MKPFLLISIRAEQRAAIDERAAFLRGTGLDSAGLHWHQINAEPLPQIDLGDYSGIILGGGAYNFSDEVKGPDQARAEGELYALLDRVVAEDFPFLGACYGIGVVGSHQGALIDGTYAEPVGRVQITLSEAGKLDPIFGQLPPSFDAFLGHKEAMTTVPPSVTILASSSGCPHQAFRVGDNVYVTQFHPELDSDGLSLRVEVYRSYGYFEPSEVDALKQMAHAKDVAHPKRILSTFVERYQR